MITTPTTTPTTRLLQAVEATGVPTEYMVRSDTVTLAKLKSRTAKDYLSCWAKKSTEVRVQDYGLKIGDRAIYPLGKKPFFEGAIVGFALSWQSEWFDAQGEPLKRPVADRSLGDYRRDYLALIPVMRFEKPLQEGHHINKRETGKLHQCWSDVQKA